MTRSHRKASISVGGVSWSGSAVSVSEQWILGNHNMLNHPQLWLLCGNPLE